MADTISSFTLLKPSIQTSSPLATKAEFNPFSRSLKQCSTSRYNKGSSHQYVESWKCNKASRVVKANALPDWPLMVSNVIEHEIFPEWVRGFLEKTFFNKCPDHLDHQKNEVNRYCVTCGASICRYCITTHGQHDKHKILKLYRHVYQDVVHLNEMENYINCEKIQPYKSNKKLVVSLTPLPHNGSGALIVGDGACNVCERKLMNPDRFSFCSIACKVQAISETGVMI